MAKVLGWAVKVKQMESIQVDCCPSIKYTDEEKKIRIRSILNENPEDWEKLVRFVLEN